MNGAVELYPLWLRLWHWLNALACLLLVVSGASLHFAGSLMPFDVARTLHNAAGLAMTAAYLFYLVVNIRSGNVGYYLPTLATLLADLTRQSLFYGVGIFRGESQPFPCHARRKFNPMQQVAYLLVMYAAVPVVVGTGLLYLFPGLLPDRFGAVDGLLPVALLHYLAGVFLAAFLIGHVYLATTGKTPLNDFKHMIRGHRVGEEHP
ncbi:MAG: cytochrome b/b6 domain-containing protein [Magnetococcales bacterium]|nr:cytochrome b/b6 domain-containing protein [Magnetococcales bacterium]